MLNIVVQNQNYTKNKFVLSAAGAVLLAASVTTFVSRNKSNDSMDDLFRANVEALAQYEIGEDYVPCFIECEEVNGGSLYIELRRCVDCKRIKVESASTQSRCWKGN